MIRLIKSYCKFTIETLGILSRSTVGGQHLIGKEDQELYETL